MTIKCINYFKHYTRLGGKGDPLGIVPEILPNDL